MSVIGKFTSPKGKSAFTIAALGFSVIPFLRGGTGIVFGARNVPKDGSVVNETVDSEYRFTHAMWFAAAPALWWIVRDAERRSDVMIGVAGAIALGGIGRSVAWRVSGRPDHVFVTAIPLEVIGVPALALWNHAIASKAKAAMAQTLADQARSN